MSEKSNFKRAFDILRQEGLASLLLGIKRHISYHYLPSLSYPNPINKFWQIKGERTLEIQGVSAKFGTSTSEELCAVRNFRESQQHEYLMTKRVLQELEPSDVFFDIGANIGVYSCLAAEIANTVVAFEPHPGNVASLEENVERNNSDVQVKNIALSDSIGKINFSRMKEEGTTGIAAITPEDSSTTVESTTGDRLVQSGKLPQPNVVKIDVEGAEPLVLQGLKDTLAQDDCRAVFCEIHLPAPYRPSIEDHGYTYDEVENMLVEMGFEISVIQEREYDIMLQGKR